MLRSTSTLVNPGQFPHSTGVMNHVSSWGEGEGGNDGPPHPAPAKEMARQRVRRTIVVKPPTTVRWPQDRLPNSEIEWRGQSFHARTASTEGCTGSY